MIDTPRAEEVQPLLGTAWVGQAWRWFAECGSTNDEALAWAQAGAPHGAVVVADTQRAGRGRQGRRWHSPAGENLYLTLVLRPRLAPAALPPLTLAVGVAAAEAVARFDVVARLKWPNDVVVVGDDGVARKLAGVLTEASGEVVLVGVGLNVHTREFPAELAATSLALVGRGADRVLVACALAERLEHWCERFLADGAASVVARWRELWAQRGARVRAGALAGVAEDVDDDGALRLRLDDGSVQRVVSGEVVNLPATRA